MLDENLLRELQILQEQSAQLQRSITIKKNCPFKDEILFLFRQQFENTKAIIILCTAVKQLSDDQNLYIDKEFKDIINGKTKLQNKSDRSCEGDSKK